MDEAGVAGFSPPAGHRLNNTDTFAPLSSPVFRTNCRVKGGCIMALTTLKDLYFSQLQDLHSACEQSLDVTAKMGAAAKHGDLGDALRAGHAGISDGLDKIRSICAKNQVDPKGAHCRGMEGLVAEAKAHALDEVFTDKDVRDAMIIAQYQRMAHYAIAGYGCLKAYADRLGFNEDAGILDECLKQTEGGDATMTRIATTKVNRDAV